jgi:hypothetical protein
MASFGTDVCVHCRWMAGWGWWGNDRQAKIEALLARLDGGRALDSEEAYISAMQREFPLL